jgi:hypothetical protein
VDSRAEPAIVDDERRKESFEDPMTTIRSDSPTNE